MERRYVLNKRCFAVLRALRESTDRRWKYIHVGPEGVTATDSQSLMRVSLPTRLLPSLQPSAAIFDYETAKGILKTVGRAVL
jgi:hypothetical protein